MSFISKSFITFIIGLAAFAGFHTARGTQELMTMTPTNQSTTTGSATMPAPAAVNHGSRTNVTTASELSSDITSNWAGYAASSGTYSGVSGSWTVPSVSSSGSTSADATWIGIGGVSTDDLIQVGTQDVVTASGQNETSAFYELLPDSSITIPDVTISAGDSVSASLVNNGSDQWTIILKDSTNGQSYSTTVNYASSENSAEWIEEDPSDGESQIPLDDFGTVSFTNGSSIDNGTSASISASGASAVTMDNESEQSLASVSTLANNGSEFSLTRTSASTVASIPQFNTDPRGWVRHGSPFAHYSSSGYETENYRSGIGESGRNYYSFQRM
jgi:hypothetical protein